MWRNLNSYLSNWSNTQLRWRLSLVSHFKLMTFIKLYWGLSVWDYSLQQLKVQLDISLITILHLFSLNCSCFSIWIYSFIITLVGSLSAKINCSFQALRININISLKTSETLKKYSIEAELFRKYQQKYQQSTSTEMFRNFHQKQGGGLEITV